jgi:thiol-disulfide isomerase/thioredoxin
MGDPSAPRRFNPHGHPQIQRDKPHGVNRHKQRNERQQQFFDPIHDARLPAVLSKSPGTKQSRGVIARWCDEHSGVDYCTMNRWGTTLCCAAVLATLAGCGGTRPIPVDQVQVTPVKAEDVMRIIRAPGAKAVLVNMWATWCGPCQEEFPDLLKVGRRFQSKGLRVVLVSNDDPTDLPAVKKFLAENGVDFPAYLKAQKDNEFVNGIYPQWDGALPATFIFDGDGKLKDYWQGESTYKLFDQKIEEVLNQ